VKKLILVGSARLSNLTRMAPALVAAHHALADALTLSLGK
jgi:hypothetical protein